MNQHGPLISYDVSTTTVTMTVSNSIAKRVEQKFREDYCLAIPRVSQQSSQWVFTFSKSVDVDTFLRHLGAATPEEYGSV